MALRGVGDETVAGAAGAGASVDVTAVVPVVLVGAEALVVEGGGAFGLPPAVDVTAGLAGFASSGKSFGAAHCRTAMKTIEMRTAVTSRFSILRDGVPTSRVEHVAARKTPKTQPTAAHGAVLFDRLHHVNGAGRLEAAHRGQNRRDESLV